MTLYRHYGKILTGGFILLVGIYFVVAQFVSPILLTEFAYSFQIPMLLMVSFAFLREVWMRDKIEKFSITDLVAVAIACLCLSFALEAGARLWARLNDTNLDDATIAFFRLIALFFSMVMLSMRGTPEKPSRLWSWVDLLMLAFSIGAIVFVYVLVSRLTSWGLA